ncbi:ATP-binding protein [Fulvivirgaceae bacterium BMA10]|uniref:histidine kinase n=1 Tax=Splendidivirga corallicola TaxID=3051826 RepID=A0ABT8KXZ3_9BACT|nr:ATP-binding protein [Fulvivirgaceae bacterium BMA10]
MNYQSLSKKRLIKELERLKERNNILEEVNSLHKRNEDLMKQLDDLRARDALLEDVLSNISMYITQIDGEGIIAQSTGLGLSRFGLRNNQLSGKNIYKKYPELAKYFDKAYKGEFVEFINKNKLEDKVWHFKNWIFPARDPKKGLINIAFDITELREKELELYKKKNIEKITQELDRSNQELEQYAFVVSHDLRSPLNSLSALIEIIALKLDNNELQEDFDMIKGVIKRMNDLINGFLDYARLSNQKLEVEEIDCNQLIEDIKTDLIEAISNKHVRIEYDDLPVIKANNAQIHQLFQNLIGNAVKFNSSKSPWVRISADQQHQDWIFAIQDNGIGIEASNTEKIFKIHQRLSNGKKYNGTGIGLSTCKKIVENHGGEIWVNSKPGEGSIFYFTIPISAQRKFK